MFVCSKVDVDESAKKYDRGDDDDDCEDGADESQENPKLMRDKKMAVFKQLKKDGFLPPEEQIDSSELFHGLSSTLVKRDRKKELKTLATMSFEHFELCILEKLESALRKQSKRDLSALLTAQELFLASVVGTQRNWALAARQFEKDCKRAKDVEEAIFTMVERLINKGDSIVKTIKHDIEKLSEILLKEARDYQYTTWGTKKEVLVEAFSCHIKGTILDRAFNVLRRSFQRVLKQSLLKTAILTELRKEINPFFRRMLQRTLGYECDLQQLDKDPERFEIYSVLEKVIDSIGSDVDVLLRKQIKSQLESVDIKQIGTAPRPEDPLWRREVVNSLLAKIDIKYLSNEVIHTCERALLKKRQEFKAGIETVALLNVVFPAEGKLDDIRTKHTPHVAHLAVRGHSLRYVIEQGPPELGPQIQTTQHGHLYCCTSPLWVHGDDCVVKVVKRGDVKQSVWSQTMLDCMHFK